MGTDINVIIQQIDSLTPIPAVTNKIMEIAGDPDGSITDVVDVLKYDADLTANLLKLCNSAYYGLKVKVDSVRQAVSLLGMNQVLEIALLANTGENMLKPQRGYGLERGELWKNSLATALVSKSIAVNKKDADQFRVYTASLIKDIGKVSLNKAERLLSSL